MIGDPCDWVVRAVEAPIDCLERLTDRLAGISAAPRSTRRRSLEVRELEVRLLELRLAELERDLGKLLARRRGDR